MPEIECYIMIDIDSLIFQVKIVKVLDLRRYKADLTFYPGVQKYFLFGDDKDAFISHLPTKCRDFQQVCWQNIFKAIRG